MQVGDTVRPLGDHDLLGLVGKGNDARVGVDDLWWWHVRGLGVDRDATSLTSHAELSRTLVP